MKSEKVQRTGLGVMAVIGALVIVLMAITGASAAPRGPESVCLGARSPSVYTVCEALRTQPAHEYEDEDGSVVGVADGELLLYRLARRGITPDGTPVRFRRAAWELTSAYFEHERGPVRHDDGSPCLTAVGPRTYVLCAALWEQPSYDRGDGSGLSSPEGSEIIAELAEAGITPSHRTVRFRYEAGREVRVYFRQFRTTF